jgi:hypothetical protein
MLDLHKRYLLFIAGCIGTRTLFTLLAKYIDTAYLPFLGALALIPVFGWLFIYFIRPRDTGVEVFGGRIWWNELRPLHAALYALFAIYAIKKKPFAYIPLAVDTCIGLAAFVLFHFSSIVIR